MSLQGNDAVIIKLLKVLNGEISFQVAASDPDFNPLVPAFTSSKPCP